MSSAQRLATRCNACGTSFRVSEEQLAISEGYVRCGRCDAVFNARANLFELDGTTGNTRPAPLDSGPAAVEAQDRYAVAAQTERDAAALSAAADPAPWESPPHEARPDVTAQAPASNLGDAGPAAPLPSAEPPASAGDSAPSASFAAASESYAPPSEGGSSAEADPAWVAEEPTWSGAALDAAPVPTERAEPAWDSLEAQAEPDSERMLALLGAAEPEPAQPAATAAAPALAANFRSLESVQRRRSAAPSRLALALGGLGAAALLLALPLHWAWIERDALRAQSPQLDTLLSTHWPALQRSGWRHLDGLSVASSSLTPTPQGGAYRLDLVVHNRNPHELAMPWLDLQLSDAKGQVLVRRAVAPDELGLAHPLKAGEQRALRAVFRIDGEARAAAGYEIGLFHP